MAISGDALEETGARIAGFDPGHLEGTASSTDILFGSGLRGRKISSGASIGYRYQRPQTLLKHDVGGAVQQKSTLVAVIKVKPLVDGSRVSKVMLA